MKSILLSIKPEWVCKILNGEKTIEIRKKFPKDYVGWVYIYCTKDKKQCLIDNLNYSEDRYTTVWALSPDRKVLKDFILNGKVVARFWCDKVEEIEHFIEPNGADYYTETLPFHSLCEKSCVSMKELREYLDYSNGKAIHISNLEVFDRPRDLSEFWNGYDLYDGGTTLKHRLTKAPQNYCYIEREKELEK